MNNVKYATVLYTTRMAQEKYKNVVYHKTMSNVIFFLETNLDSDPTRIFLLDLIKIHRFTIPTNCKKIILIHYPWNHIQIELELKI